MKIEPKSEPIKTEIKVEEVAPGPSSFRQQQQQMHGRTGGVPGKEEEYDSSATVSYYYYNTYVCNVHYVQ